MIVNFIKSMFNMYCFHLDYIEEVEKKREISNKEQKVSLMLLVTEYKIVFL